MSSINLETISAPARSDQRCDGSNQGLVGGGRGRIKAVSDVPSNAVMTPGNSHSLRDFLLRSSFFSLRGEAGEVAEVRHNLRNIDQRFDSGAQKIQRRAAADENGFIMGENHRGGLGKGGVWRETCLFLSV